MRILLTTDTIGGVWTFTRELAQELLFQGHQVALVSFGRPPAPEQADWSRSMAHSYPEAFSYESSAAPLEWMDENERAYDEGAEVLLQAIVEFRPDIIHSNQFCFGSLPADTPIVVTAHSDVLSWAAASLPKRLDPSPWLSRYIDLAQQGLDRCRALTAPSEWMLEALGANFLIHPPARVIPNGRTLPPNQTTRGRKLQAVTAGRLWDRAKNIGLLAAFKSPIPVLIAGEIGHGRPEVSDLSSRAKLIGPLCEPTLHQVFRASSIYLAPSLYEPFGLAALEAALCGCAVVANDIASLREVWDDAALYFGNEDELKALLDALVADQTFLAEARRRSYRRARQFSARRMADAYLALYQDLVRSPCPVEARELAAHAR